MIFWAETSIVSRFTSFAQVISCPTRRSTSTAAPWLSSRCERSVNGARSPSAPSIFVAATQWAWITAFFDTSNSGSVMKPGLPNA